MARKKCHECLTCFQYFWIDGKRYYYCVICQKYYEGRDDDLHECENPRQYYNLPVEIKEQDEH
jgi:hypothetical protein